MAWGGDGCRCDYSYICPQCQDRIDRENERMYQDEVKEWTAECIKLIAEKLNITIPEHPERRRRGY